METERGRPLGMSRVRDCSLRDSRREEEECFSRLEVCEEEVLEDELVFEDLEEDFDEGTSRMFRMRPVVGSVVESMAGSCDTW